MSNPRDTRKALILLVEDDPNDQILIKRAFNKANIINPIQVVDDGEKAIQYLLGEGAYKDRDDYPLPIAILLDLKLPKKSGLEVLEIAKDLQNIKRIPIIILTSSKDSSDIDKAYEMGVNSYLVKPVRFNDLVEIIVSLGLYWILLNEHPNIEE